MHQSHVDSPEEELTLKVGSHVDSPEEYLSYLSLKRIENGQLCTKLYVFHLLIRKNT